MGLTARQQFGRDGEGSDHLRAGREVLFLRQHTDHLPDQAVQRHRGSQHRGIRAEPPLPEAVAQKHHEVFARLGFLGSE